MTAQCRTDRPLRRPTLGRLAMLLGMALLGMAVLAATPAWSLTINLFYNASLPSEPELRPADDPTASRLMAVVRSAADYWESILLDTRTVSFGLAWGDRGPGSLASSFTNPSPAISFNGNVNWFFDDGDGAIFDDSEFDLGFANRATASTLYGDLTASQQSMWFRGPAPNYLEATYQGADNGSDPNASATDLYTVALHELGHHLGNFGTGETSDGFWDFTPAQIGGRNVGLATPPGNGSHTAPPQTLMFPTVASGERKLPSTSDILAIAKANAWNSIDLPRKDFIGKGAWNTAGNWIGNRVPDAGDDVFIRRDEALVSVNLTADAHASNLFIGERAYFQSSGLDVFVGQNTGGMTIVDGDDADTTFFLTGGSTLRTGNLALQNDATLNVQDGFVLVYDEKFTIDANSLLVGGAIGGNITLLNSAQLLSTGTIAARGGGVLRLNAEADEAWDFGNLSTSTLEALTGDILIESGGQIGNIPEFGLMQIGAGHLISHHGEWLVNSRLEMSGGSAISPAKLKANKLTYSGVLVVDSGTGILEGDLALGVFFGGNRFEVAAGAELLLNGPIKLVKVDMVGGGTVRQNGDMVVTFNENTIDVDIYDWDGLGSRNTTIMPGAMLEINSRLVGGTAADGHGGRIEINGGRLKVETDAPWKLEAAGKIVLATGDNKPANLLGIGFTNQGEISGEGFVDVDTLVNNGVIDSSSLLGDLVFIVDDFDLDGVGVAGDETGVLRVSKSGRLLINTAFTFPQTFNGEIFLANGSTLEIRSGGLTLGGGSDRGQMQSSGGTLITPQFNHRGDLTLGPFGLTLDAPTVLGAGGTTATATGTFFSGDLRLLQDTTFEAGHTLTGDGRILIAESGRLSGTGAIAWPVEVAGGLAPGATVGLLTINNPLTFEETGRLEIQIGGATSGQFDRLSVPSTVTLAGELSVGLVGLGGGVFTPSQGEVFRVISAALINGEFDGWNLPALPFGLIWRAEQDLISFELQVLEGLAGDYNFDGVVDAADYTVWRDSLGQTGINLIADGDYSGAIDEGDYNVWKSNFGESILATLHNAAQPAPEPPAGVMLVGVLVAGMFYAARRRLEKQSDEAIQE